MNTIQTFFSKHPKWSYTGNLVVTLACVCSGVPIFVYADRFRSAAWICSSYRY